MTPFIQIFPENIPTASSSLRIISHNVFWFQGVPFSTDRPPEPEPGIFEKLIALYKKLQPDILCLQEIQSESVAQSVAEALAMQYVHQAIGRYPQYGGSVFSRYPMTPMSLTNNFQPDRMLLAVSIQSPIGILKIANIHLPSGRQRGAGSQAQRLLEISQLAGHTDILMGDFNESPTGACAAFLKEQGYADVAETYKAGDMPTNKSASFRGDQIWISKTAHSSLKGYLAVTRDAMAIQNSNKTFLSDHFPIGCLLH